MPETTDDLLDRARTHLPLCGSCDVGCCTPCTCPPGDFRDLIRDLIAEIENLRAGLDLGQRLSTTSTQVGA